MSIPPGHPQETKFGYVGKLKKAIYGLRQSPRAWYAKLSSVLMFNRLNRSGTNPSLFVKRSKFGIIIVLVYVNDIVITGDDEGGISELKALLKDRFAIKDLGC